MNVEDLRRVLRSSEEIPAQAFSLVREIARLNADPDQAETAHEMILRALEHRQRFGPSEAVVSALARAVGLFPYLNPEDLSLRDSIAYEFHRPPAMGEDFVFHREQAEVYRRLMAGESVILSAPTSFGKSRIIDALIAADRFDNLVILVPTLALIDETRRRMASYSDRYKIVTHLTQKPGPRTIFVFTAERAVSYDAFDRIEFFVIDEFYKIDALDEDSSRTVALNQAFYKLRKRDAQFYLLGPSIQKIPDGVERAFRCYFYPTKFTTVVSEQVRISASPQNEIEKFDAAASAIGIRGARLPDSVLVFSDVEAPPKPAS